MCSARSMLRIEDAPLFYRRSVKFSMDQSVKRGDIYYADLSPVVGSEQGGVRPVLIVQNDMGNGTVQR
jgi:mRNA interferase MazF